jgi:putative heme-binding domain-containing protein
MAKTGPGRMPHIGSGLVDQDGLRLMHDWIASLAVHKDERAVLERLRAADEAAALAHEEAVWETNLKRSALTYAKSKGRGVANDDDRIQAAAQLQARAAAAVKDRAGQRGEAIGKLLASTPSALVLAQAMAEDRIPSSARAQVLAAATGQDAQVRDLFERFLPDEQRVKRLGSTINPEQILALKGNPERGRELFFKSSGLQCSTCHRIEGKGSNFGPDLSQIGKQATPAKILESLLEPSKSIDPKYVAYLVETKDGKLYTGLLVEKTAKEVVLKVQADKDVRVAASEVERIAPQSRSLMPDQLLRDLTQEQAADLLAFLASLK